MSTPIVAPYVPTYAATQPYATAAEFNNYPTGVNMMEIVPGASQSIQSDTLEQLLIEASSEADGICNQVLACTQEIQYGRYRVDPEGQLLIPADQSPLVQVDAVSAGLAGAISPVSLTGATFPSRNILRVPYNGPTDNTGRADVQMTYLAGYPNALTAGASLAGATSLTLTSVLGVQLGSTLRVYDPGSSENVTVAAINGNTITLVAPAVSPHASGVGVSALPAAIREAAILLTAVKVKAKASQSTVMASLNGNVTTRPEELGAGQFGAAMDLLAPYVRV